MNTPPPWCEAVEGGLRIVVRVQPGARRQGVLGAGDAGLRVAVTAQAERGRANEAVRAVVAAWLGVAPSRVELVAGASSRTKRLLLHGVTAGEFDAAMELLGE